MLVVELRHEKGFRAKDASMIGGALQGNTHRPGVLRLELGSSAGTNCQINNSGLLAPAEHSGSKKRSR